jgi:DNA-binding ferritin-like protein
VSLPPPRDPIAALNQVLSEVIDLVLDVKQAHRKVPETHALHAELDALFDDVRTWARLLVDEDATLGFSPLTRMPSIAGRTQPNLWPGTPTDEDVRQVVDEYLDRLGQHVATALAEQEDQTAQSVLAELERGVLAHRRALDKL